MTDHDKLVFYLLQKGGNKRNKATPTNKNFDNFLAKKFATNFGIWGGDIILTRLQIFPVTLQCC